MMSQSYYILEIVKKQFCLIHLSTIIFTFTIIILISPIILSLLNFKKQLTKRINIFLIKNKFFVIGLTLIFIDLTGEILQGHVLYQEWFEKSPILLILLLILVFSDTFVLLRWLNKELFEDIIHLYEETKHKKEKGKKILIMALSAPKPDPKQDSESDSESDHPTIKISEKESYYLNDNAKMLGYEMMKLACKAQILQYALKKLDDTENSLPYALQTKDDTEISLYNAFQTFENALQTLPNTFQAFENALQTLPNTFQTFENALQIFNDKEKLLLEDLELLKKKEKSIPLKTMKKQKELQSKCDKEKSLDVLELWSKEKEKSISEAVELLNNKKNSLLKTWEEKNKSLLKNDKENSLIKNTKSLVQQAESLVDMTKFLSCMTEFLSKNPHRPLQFDVCFLKKLDWRHPWLQNLKGIDPHFNSLKKLHVFTSNESAKHKDKFEKIIKHYKDIDIKFHKVDFNSPEEILNELQELRKRIKNGKEYNNEEYKDKDIVIDVTSGTKPISIVFTMMTLTNDISIQYIGSEGANDTYQYNFVAKAEL